MLSTRGRGRFGCGKRHIVEKVVKIKAVLFKFVTPKDVCKDFEVIDIAKINVALVEDVAKLTAKYLKAKLWSYRSLTRLVVVEFVRFVVVVAVLVVISHISRIVVEPVIIWSL
jgi:hypothetical protein